MEWGVHKIRVNTISPGYIVTAMVEELFIKYPERKADWPTQNMLGRLSSPSEYRGAAVFLISDASSFMVSYLELISLLCLSRLTLCRLGRISEWTVGMPRGRCDVVVKYNNENHFEAF